MEDLHLLAQLCQENLRAEVPSGEFFLVKCAVRKKVLMILAEHPEGVNVDTQNVFAVIEESLNSENTFTHRQAEVFIRRFGRKLPYVTCSINLDKHSSKLSINYPLAQEVNSSGNSQTITQVETLVSVVDVPFSDKNLEKSLNKNSSHWDSNNESSHFSYAIVPLSSQPVDSQTVDAQFVDLQSEDTEIKTPKNKFLRFFSNHSYISIFQRVCKREFPEKGAKPYSRNPYAIAAGILSVIAVFGGAGNLLMRPCVIGKCTQLETVLSKEKNLKTEIENIKSAPELLALQENIDFDKKILQSIPFWSPHHGKAIETVENLSEQSKEINSVVKAFKNGTAAAKISQTKAESIEELRARQNLWRQAIAPLESVSTRSNLYPIVKPKLFSYSNSLKIINRQLLTERKWLKKINDSKSVAGVAKQRAQRASSLQNWQKAQSTWQIAANGLNSVPRNSVVYSDAQKILSEYIPKLNAVRKRTTQELVSTTSYNLAIAAAKEAQKYAQQNQWSLTVIQWNRALNALNSIPENTAHHQRGKSQIPNYALKLKQAQQNLRIVQKWQRTRNDLEQTCYGEIEICQYTLDSKGITVRITPEYEESLEKSFIDASIEQDSEAIASVNANLQILQQALEAISSNADLPLLVYDAQGEVIQKSRLVM